MGLLIVLTVAAIPAVAAWFAVTGYVLDGGTLFVKRLVSETRIPLDGLREASHEPEACKGSLRVFGNGGLYAFTGLYQNRRLGRFRLYGTDLAKSVVLSLPEGTVVVTPEQPEAFVDSVRQHIAKAGTHHG